MDKALRQLREQIIASPDDVALRRVYADRLVERGDPRGLFIQVQCELADSWLSAERRAELVSAEDKLLYRHFADWIRPAMVSSPRQATFVRGFLERWTCRAGDFIARGNRVARSAPLRAVTLTEVGDNHFQHLLTLRSFRGLEAITLRGLNAWPRVWASGGPTFARLDHLSLSGGAWGWDHPTLRFEPWFARLLSSQWVENLTSLEVDLPLQPADGDALGGSPLIRRLRRLRLTSGFHQAVIPNGPAPALEELDVDLHDDASALVAQLGQSPRLSRLTLRATAERTYLYACRATPPRVLRAALGALPRATSSLTLWNAALDGETVDALLATRLAELRVSHCRVAEQDLRRLDRRFANVAHRGTAFITTVDRLRAWLDVI